MESLLSGASPSSQELVLSLSESLFLSDFFNLSNNLLWNLFKLDWDPFFGGDDAVLLMGLCKLLCEVLELFLEYCLDMFAGTLRWVGEVPM